MVSPRRSGKPVGFGPGRATRSLCIAILVCSLVLQFMERRLGFGASTFIFTVPGVLDGELWRLASYPFVEPNPFNLILGLIVFYLFGSAYEQRWGVRAYLRFIGASWVGAAVIAVPLNILINAVMPFEDNGIATGPGSAIDALLVVLALTAPDSNVMFGFVLPIKAKTLVYLLLGFQLIVGIQLGAAGLAITLGGMAMGYLLATGTWRPRMLFERLRARLQRRRRGLYVVPPRKDHTLH